MGGLKRDAYRLARDFPRSRSVPPPPACGLGGGTRDGDPDRTGWLGEGRGGGVRGGRGVGVGVVWWRSPLDAHYPRDSERPLQLGASQAGCAPLAARARVRGRAAGGVCVCVCAAGLGGIGKGAHHVRPAEARRYELETPR